MTMEKAMPEVSPHRDFANDGFAGPFVLGSPAQMSFVALHLMRSVFSRPGPLGSDTFVDRHLDSALVAQLCTHPAIIAQVEPLLGEDLVVWRSLFFSKGPDSMEIPWHQDGHFWKLDPPVTITAWLAIDRAHSEDRCLEVIPGSHKTILPHVPSPLGSQFQETIDSAALDVSRALELPMEAGTFVLFDRGIAHRSRAGGESRRLALSVRIAPAMVRIDPALLPPDGRVLPMRTTNTERQGLPGDPSHSRLPE
jgi:ectoine hydroxylase-related dioxygenase (phytanoyl-CoA dioxygenase family)